MTTSLLNVTQGPFETTLDALFSGPMLLSSLLDASRYQLSGGIAYVYEVEPLFFGNVLPTGVRLWVEGFQGEESFVLTVSGLLRDAAGDVLPPNGRVSSPIYPFQSTAHLSNTDGLVRSWHESKLIFKDSQRAYLVSTRGLDAFDIAGGVQRPTRWAQILDAYGFVAACLSSTNDYIFTDTTPPVLGGRNPAPGATGISPNTSILLTIADRFTSIGITQIAIYLRNSGSILPDQELVFSGVSGWTFPQVCGGRIAVERQMLNIQLFPIQPLVNGPVIVSVFATDLKGNVLNTSYTFYIGSSPVIDSFGEGPFGEMFFGD
jgi:hypothetical protein